MNSGEWFILVNLLPLAAVGLLLIRRAWFAVPWLALATVVVATTPTFSLSAAVVTYGNIGSAVSGVATFFLGLATVLYSVIGLSILFCYVRLQPVAFVPLGAVLAGLISIASFYGYIPPFNSGRAVDLIFAAPGFALVIYGVYLWHRHGLSGGMQPRSLGLRLTIALGIVAGFGAIGLLGYQSEPHRPNSAFFSTLDVPRLASNSVLAVEGVVVHKESWAKESQRPSGRTFTIRYTLYRVEVSEFWRGEKGGTVPIAVPGFSPVDLMQGQPYLLFLGDMADQEEVPGHWYLVDPRQVWTVNGDSFHPHFGLNPATPLSRQELTELLAEYPVSTPTPQAG